MDDNEKKRIIPVVVEQDGEVDSIISEEAKDNNGFEEVKAPDIGIMPSSPMESERKKGSKLTFVLVMILVALVVALLVGGVYVYTQGTTDSTPLDPTPLATQIPTDETQPSPTPEEKVDVSKLKVNILNGSGKIGEAGKVKTAIEKEGFKVAATGNAATFDFEETVIAVKEGVSDSVVDMLKNALSDTYKIEVGENLKTTSSFDIVITVGSK
ncbi:MAG: LytR C-terminal domain-containing protein [Patescibacteria group bacterium]